jgi:tetratricopeptide (TPR) repeat protein
VLGSGAGTFERLWRERGDSNQRVRDAHGLYLETLAELGPVGLALLLVTLSVPLVAAVLARGVRLVPAVAGAYLAFVLHAGVDWDWELAGVTLTALLLGAVLIIASRTTHVRLTPARVRIAVAGLAAVASVGVMLGGLGNSALAHAQSAIARRDVDTALTEADRARQLMPWSGRPWLLRGEAELAAGDTNNAAKSFRRSIAIDERDWRAWLDLAIATEGRERARALAQARRLYPRSTEIARTAALLAGE